MTFDELCVGDKFTFGGRGVDRYTACMVGDQEQQASELYDALLADYMADDPELTPDTWVRWNTEVFIPNWAVVVLPPTTPVELVSVDSLSDQERAAWQRAGLLVDPV